MLRYDQRSSHMILWKRRNFVESKLLWACNGLKLIFKRFFRFCSKIYENRSSAQESHRKSLKSCLRNLHNVLNEITEEFFICQKSYGNPARFHFFYIQFFFSVTVPGPGRYQNQNLLRYDQRPSYMIVWKRGDFGESKLLL